METLLRYRGREVTDQDASFIRELIRSNPGDSRRAISLRLCEAWTWVQPNGSPRDMVCRGLLLALHRAGHIELPPVQRPPLDPCALRRKPKPVETDRTPLRCRLADLGPLTFLQVRRRPEEPLFDGLIEMYHYLGYTRFLIPPWVEVPHLASHLLGRMARMLPGEWAKMYGHPVYFAETFVDPARNRGTCYYAANWVNMGQTTGRGKDDHTNKVNRSIKDVLGLPLTKRFRSLLMETE